MNNRLRKYSLPRWPPVHSAGTCMSLMLWVDCTSSLTIDTSERHVRQTRRSHISEHHKKPRGTFHAHSLCPRVNCSHPRGTCRLHDQLCSPTRQTTYYPKHAAHRLQSSLSYSCHCRANNYLWYATLHQNLHNLGRDNSLCTSLRIHNHTPHKSA